MRFGKKLCERLIVAWSEGYIDYEGLKELIKILVENDTETLEQLKQIFLLNIDLESTKVDDFFLKELAYLKKAVYDLFNRIGKITLHDKTANSDIDLIDFCNIFNLSENEEKDCTGLTTDVVSENEEKKSANLATGMTEIIDTTEEDENEELSTSVVELYDELLAAKKTLENLRSFSTLNFRGFVKILKKFDKNLGTNTKIATISSMVMTKRFYFGTGLANLLTQVKCMRFLLARQIEASSETAEDLFGCPICLSSLNAPIIIPCGHTFCRDCYTRYHQFSKRHKKELLCPVCRRIECCQESKKCVDPIFDKFLSLVISDYATVSKIKEDDIPCPQEELAEPIYPLMQKLEKRSQKYEPTGYIELFDINQILKHCKKGSFIVFDLDDVVLTSQYVPCMLLTSEGTSNFNYCLSTSQNDLPLKTREEIYKIYYNAIYSNYCPVEKDTVEVITALQKGGPTVFALTARHKSTAKQTRQQLLDIGVDFMRAAPFPKSFGNYTIEDNVTGAQYLDGILYAGRHPKGEVLSRFLDMLQQQDIGDQEIDKFGDKIKIPKEIMFIDDQLYNIESVLEWLSPRKSSHSLKSQVNKQDIPNVTCYHYLRASHKYIEKLYGIRYDQVVKGSKNMSHAIIKMQLKKLFFDQEFINDEIAVKAILEREYCKSEKGQDKVAK